MSDALDVPITVVAPCHGRAAVAADAVLNIFTLVDEPRRE
jgi:hypothetical protein